MSNRTTLKSYFQTGDKPTQAQFYDLIDSLFHRTEDALDWSSISGKPSTFAPSAHTHPWAEVTGKPTFATVATSGAYADLSGLPSLFSGAWADLSGKPSTFAPSAHTHPWTDITGKPTFATVATSGAYADLSGKPTLATVATSGAYADLTGKPVMSAASGAAVDFVADKRYGTVGSPITANITATYTGGVAGATICIVHANGTAPTFPTEFKRVGTVAYDTTKTNFIWAIFTGDSTRVEYLITQEA